MVESTALTALTTESERIEEDALYSAKGHFEAARDWQRWNLIIGLPTTLGASLAAGTSLAEASLIAGVLSALAAAGAALLTFLNPSGRATTHAAAGNAYKSLQNRSRVFREISCADPAATDADLRDALLKLSSERDELNASSPLPSRRAFDRARKGIESGEASYAIDQSS